MRLGTSSVMSSVYACLHAFKRVQQFFFLFLASFLNAPLGGGFNGKCSSFNTPVNAYACMGI